MTKKVHVSDVFVYYPKLSAGVAKRDVENTPKCTCLTCILAQRSSLSLAFLHHTTFHKYCLGVVQGKGDYMSHLSKDCSFVKEVLTVKTQNIGSKRDLLGAVLCLGQRKH